MKTVVKLTARECGQLVVDHVRKQGFEVESITFLLNSWASDGGKFRGVEVSVAKKPTIAPEPPKASP